MKFLVDFKDGKFHLAQHISEHCWAEVSSISGNSEFFDVRFMRFDTKFKFEFPSSIYLNCEAVNGVYQTNVNLAIKDSSEEKSYQLDFSSDKPLCEACSVNRCKAFVWFLNFVDQFETAEEASIVISTRNVFDYRNPEELKQHIEEVSKILRKYQSRPNFYISDRIIKWLKDALLKFGILVAKYTQINETFPYATAVLNDKGYTLSDI